MSSVPLIDPRMLEKPGKFNGGMEKWSDWSFISSGYLGAMGIATQAELELLESKDKTIEQGTLTPDEQRRSTLM